MFYEKLQAHEWYYQPDKPEYAFAAKYIPPAARVLEVGCGMGAFAAFLPSATTYRGLEFNDIAVQKARAAGLDVDKNSLDQEALAHSGFYDVVCHFQVLEHVANPALFLRHAAMALRPGGRMILAVPAEDSFVGLAESCWLNMPPHHLTRWTDECLRRTVSGLSLRLEALWHEPVASYHSDWHEDVLLACALRSVCFQRPRLLASRSLQRISRLLGSVSAVRAWLRAYAIRTYPTAMNGHTVCVVAAKLVEGDVTDVPRGL